MNLRPEDVKKWTVREFPSVEAKKKAMLAIKDKGRVLGDVYEKLKKLLEKYPPHPDYFSLPFRDQHNPLTFWVRSEDRQITIRAVYKVWEEICWIDKLFLPGEKVDLDE